MLSAHMRGILLPSRGKVPLCGGVARSAGVVIVPHPPPQNGVAASEPLLAKIINCLFAE